MISFSFVYACVCAAAVLAGPTARPMQVHDSRAGAPQGFVLTGPAPVDATLDLRLALVQNDIAGLHEALYAVSTPDSPLYGQYLSKEEVEKFVAPKAKSVAAVNAWLADNGIQASVISPAGDWLSFSVPVSKASTLFDADFAVYTHEATGETSIRTLAYSVPSDLKEHIALVHPTTSARIDTRVSAARTVQQPDVADVVPASCTRPIRPQCLLDLYGVPNGTRATNSSNKLAVTGYDKQFANEADLQASYLSSLERIYYPCPQSFLTQFRPDLPSSTTFTLQTLNGGTNSQNISQAGTEADLDTQYTVGVATGVPVVFISVGAAARGHESFLDTANFLLSETNPPQVVTTSYDTLEDGTSLSLANNLCNAYAQLGARGTSILFASGDSGVGNGGNCTKFVSKFPNDCPFVTSVGATTGVGPETAASLSSGGFSNIFGTPTYQQPAVDAYLSALGSTNAGLFNRTGRGFPDVSAQGTDVRIVARGKQLLVEGTSCASPIFASVVALLNDALAAAGRPPLGFLNPFLYSDKGRAALTDITAGSNPGCGTQGFPAMKGWDPVTGLGTPNYSKLKAALGL
ncbi:subtilisin-like protein [Trametes polyzona]|nr:subtilisin-like protein [Trametes polyzona]